MRTLGRDNASSARILINPPHDFFTLGPVNPPNVPPERIGPHFNIGHVRLLGYFDDKATVGGEFLSLGTEPPAPAYALVVTEPNRGRPF